jgi:septum formation protein
MKLILGSASKWRKQILAAAGYIFSVMDPNIDEKTIRHADPEQLVLMLAKAKAEALLPKIHGAALLITTDQVVVCNGEIFEKPANSAEARYYMGCYNKYPAFTYTAIVVTNTETKHQVSEVDIAKVYFKPIPDEVIEELISHGEIFHCAGGFQIEGESGELNDYIKKVEGDVDSVKGLPLKLLRKILSKASYV